MKKILASIPVIVIFMITSCNYESIPECDNRPCELSKDKLDVIAEFLSDEDQLDVEYIIQQKKKSDMMQEENQKSQGEFEEVHNDAALNYIAQIPKIDEAKIILDNLCKLNQEENGTPEEIWLTLIKHQLEMNPLSKNDLWEVYKYWCEL